MGWRSLDTFAAGAETTASAQRMGTESGRLALTVLTGSGPERTAAVAEAVDRTRKAIAQLAERGRGDAAIQRTTDTLNASVTSVEAGAAKLEVQRSETEQLQAEHQQLVDQFLVAVDRIAAAQQETLAQAIKSVDTSLEQQNRLSSLVAMASHALRLSFELRLGDEILSKDEEIARAKASATTLGVLVRKLTEVPALSRHLGPATEAVGKYREVILALESGRDRQRELAPLSDTIIEGLKAVDGEIINMQSETRSRLADARDQVTWATDLITRSGGATQAAKTLQLSEFQLLRTAADADAQAMDSAADQLRELMEAMRFRVKSPEIAKVIQGLRNKIDTYRTAIPTILKALKDSAALRRQLATTSGDMVARVQQVGEAQLRAMEEQRTRSLWLLGSGLALALLLGTLMAYLIGRGIIRPVNALVGSMRKLADGDLSAEIPGADRRDEMGEMAKTVTVFKDAGIEKRRIEAEAVETRRAAEAERQAAETARAEAAQRQATVVTSVAAGLSHLAQGDLRHRLNEPFAPEYEALRTDFNQAVDTLQETVQTIADAASKIRTGTDEIGAASDDLSRRTEQQAAALEESSAALDEITSTTQKSAESAERARTLVGSAAGEAERSGEVVRDAIAAMGKIEQSSDKIAQIISVIDEIAFQTNLLALNAGVEAARAGETGRGFAVVAQEVRALAQRSAEAAKEIGALIETSSRLVDDGVRLVGNAGDALMRIADEVGDINAVVIDIAASAKQQAVGLGEVNAAINQMDQVTQHNAAMVEQSTAASHGLAGEAMELERLLGHFKLDTAEHAVVELRPAARKSPPRAAPRPATHGNLALAADAEEDWQEF